MLKNLYETIISAGELLQSPLLLLCRLYWGFLFASAGFEKLSNISHFSQFLETSQLPLPAVLAFLVGSIEFLGGLCFLFGFASRLAAIPLICVMVGAYLTVHTSSLHAIFKTPSVFVAEAPFNFLLASCLILAFGPGIFSIDAILKRGFFKKGKKGKA